MPKTYCRLLRNREPGSAGHAWSGGVDGSGGDEAALKAQVGALTLKVEALEGILQGITNGDPTGMLATLDALNVLPIPDVLPTFDVCPAP